jgi:hypothetical protein
MRMKALHATAGTAHAPRRPGTGPTGGDGGVAFGGVALVGTFQWLGSHCGLGRGHAPGRLQTVDPQAVPPAYEPVASRHGGAVIQDGAVANDDRPTVGVAEHNLVRPPRPAPEEGGQHI